QNQNRVAGRHRGAHQRNAERQRRRGGANRLRLEAKRLNDMRIRLMAFALAGGLVTVNASAQHITIGDSVRRVLPTTYQGRNRGPEQTERFSRKIKVGRDGRVTDGNIAGEITVTGGSGDEVSIEAVKRTRGDRSELGTVQIIVDDRA